MTMFNSLPLTAFLQPNDDPGDVLASLIRLLENNDIYSNRVVNGEGAVVFVFVNSDCLKFCQSRRLMMNSGDTASILDQGNFIVRYLYMANDNAQLPCLQLLFTDCTKWSSALCDMNIYGNGPNITSLSNAANSAVTCAADNGGLNTTGRILIIVLPCFFIAVIIIIAMCLRYKKSVQRLRMQIFGTQLLGERAKKDQAKNLYTDLLLAVASKKDDWEIEPRDLTILHDSLLGSGAFSNVYKGTLAGRIPVLTVNPNLNLVMDSYSTGSTVVAVKKLPSHADDSNRLESFQEIEFMKQLGYHAHVVSMLGCVSNPIDPLIVVEYCAHGDLLKFIRKHKDHLLMDRDDVCPIDVDLCLRMKNLISFAWQIADGMVYLSSKNFIHRDLAARNVLITNTLVAKISDFGLCRQLSTSLYTSRGGRLPIKWMAIESLKYYEFTSSSDVWSFAILLFELFSLGESPYPAIQPTDMISHLEGGNRLPQPEKCPNEVYAIMENCWNVLPAERTTFPRLRDDLTTLLNSDDENYGYITLRNPANMPKMSPESIHRQISKQDVELQSLGRVSSVVSEFEHKYDIVPEDEGQ
ncbi:unnamed protein product [Caenorhabditis auriculariae]|uniref:Protein kinase domain-containing protein n=1 Tax=Caenorhabditis auriculariae TaxID=2777116 RepID=A0A8S1HVM2_9PELO|nr:unnamed protein product [Caenorhabditis auriculariae]